MKANEAYETLYAFIAAVIAGMPIMFMTRVISNALAFGDKTHVSGGSSPAKRRATSLGTISATMPPAWMMRPISVSGTVWTMPAD